MPRTKILQLLNDGPPRNCTAVKKATRNLEPVRKGKGGVERFGIFEEGLWNDVKWMKECLHGGGGMENGIKGTCCVWTVTGKHACLTRPWPDHCCLSYFSLKSSIRAPPCNLTVQPTCESHSHCAPSEKATGLQGCHWQQLLLTPPDNSSVVSDLSPTSLTSSDTVLPSNLQAHAYKTSYNCGLRKISSHSNISWH